MADYTDYFVKLSDSLSCSSTSQNETTSIAKSQTIEEILAELLEDINSLEDYKTLIDLLPQVRSSITLRFADLFFEFLCSVEDKLWVKYIGDKPDFHLFYSNHIDLLFEDIYGFVYEYEKDIVDWTKDKGYFYEESKYQFIHQRNLIYAQFATFICEVLCTP